MADEDGTLDSVVESDAGDITPPASNTWWQFDSQTDAEKWANDLVTKRLSRHKKTSVDPVVEERDTLKAELERLRPLEDATKTDSERFEAEKARITAENVELRAFKAESVRTELVRSIADAEGLPASFIGRVGGSDEVEIREDIQDLLNALSEGGSNTGKKKPPAKAPKANDGAGDGSVSSGGGGNSDEPTDADLAKSILDEAKAQRKNGGLRSTVRR